MSEKNVNSKSVETTATPVLDFKKIISDYIKNNTLPLVRAPFTSNGQEMFAYAVNDTLYQKKGGVIIGEKPIKVDFVAKDYGGYEVLSFLFEVSDNPVLKITDETMVNEKSGEVTSYRTFTVMVTDGDGIPYEYKVKPFKESDKSLLDALISQKAFAAYKLAQSVPGTSDNV